MMRIRMGFTFAVSLLSVCANATTLTANKLWQTEAQFKNPESVVFDEVRNVLYVSNVAGDARDRDGYGFISRMTPDGQVTDLEWVTGLNGPKGMAIVNDKLYVADIDELLQIDLSTATVSHRYPASGARFLNDVTADAIGTVYVSDMFTNRIHRLYNGVFEVWMEGSQLENPNGLLAAEGKLYVGTWGAIRDGFNTDVPGHIKVISPADKSISDFGSDKAIGNMDGIELLADGSILATDWVAGGLMIIDSSGAVYSLLDLNQGSADIEYIPAASMVIVPMMTDGTVTAYQLVEPLPELPAAESDLAAPAELPATP